MAISTSREGQTLIVKTGDRIDGANARELQVDLEAAIEPSDRGLVLDLEDLSYISSAGLRVILLTAKTLRKQNAKLAVCSLSGSVREGFEISGFDKIIPVHDTQVDATAALKN